MTPPLGYGATIVGTPGVMVIRDDFVPLRFVRMTINDSVHQLAVEETEFLADSLRERLGLTGLKVSCAMGNCGTCTVGLDGSTVYSCLVLSVECEGSQIDTIEGLGQGDRLDPVQEAFLEADALQCGFCTPGQILSLRAVLNAHPDPSDEELVRGMSGNLCRCGAYRHILEAARIAVDREVGHAQ